MTSLLASVLEEPIGKAERERLTGIGKGVIHRIWGARHCPPLSSRLYRPLMLQKLRVIFMDIPSAEMTKYAANAMLATRISFMNDITNLCERVGTKVESVRKDIHVLVPSSSMLVAAMVVAVSP